MLLCSFSYDVASGYSDTKPSCKAIVKGSAKTFIVAIFSWPTMRVCSLETLFLLCSLHFADISYILLLLQMEQEGTYAHLLALLPM